MKEIAKATLWMERGTKPRQKLTVRIGKPERDPLPRGDFRCQISISTILGKRFAYGIDSMQALMLATVYVNIHMRLLARQGCRFYMTKTDKEQVPLLFAWTGEKTKQAKRRRT